MVTPGPLGALDTIGHVGRYGRPAAWRLTGDHEPRLLGPRQPPECPAQSLARGQGRGHIHMMGGGAWVPRPGQSGTPGQRSARDEVGTGGMMLNRADQRIGCAPPLSSDQTLRPCFPSTASSEEQSECQSPEQGQARRCVEIVGLFPVQPLGEVVGTGTQGPRGTALVFAVAGASFLQR